MSDLVSMGRPSRLASAAALAKAISTGPVTSTPPSGLSAAGGRCHAVVAYAIASPTAAV